MVSLYNLAGLRPELQEALERIGITDRLGEQFIFPEEEKDYSATLGAIRAAYGMLAFPDGVKGKRAAAYYLV